MPQAPKSNKAYHKVILRVESATLGNIESAAYSNNVPLDATFSFVPSPEGNGFIIRNDGGMFINNGFAPVEVWVEFRWVT